MEFVLFQSDRRQKANRLSHWDFRPSYLRLAVITASPHQFRRGGARVT
jgi:hypothetical protein